jgi:hypothetical protein
VLLTGEGRHYYNADMCYTTDCIGTSKARSCPNTPLPRFLPFSCSRAVCTTTNCHKLPPTMFMTVEQTRDPCFFKLLSRAGGCGFSEKIPDFLSVTLR